jgi:hypothetical protein
MRVLWIMAMGAALACGQTSTQLFPFAHAASAEQFQSIALAVRTVGAIEDVSVDADAKALSVTGTADQIAMADFLFHAFDVDPRGPWPTTQEYPVPHAGDDDVRVFYFKGLKPAQLQQIVNMMRTIADVTRIYQSLQADALAVRGTSAQISASGWMAATITQPPAPGQHEFILPPSADNKARVGAVLRIFFLAHNQTQQDIQEVVNGLRTITGIAKIYPYPGPRAIALRGHPEEIALAEWLVDKLDRTPATENSSAAFVASPVYSRDPPAVRVFYLPSVPTPEGMVEKVNAIRATTRILKIYPFPALRAIALRGTDSQVAEAEALLK